MVTAPFVLRMMLLLLAKEPSSLPWIDWLAVEAEAIADESSARPLPGMTPGLSAAVDVVWSWREARYNPEAWHDDRSGYGLFGTHEATLGRPVPLDVEGQLFAFHELARLSVGICKGEGRAREEWFGWYAAGGQGCDRRLGLSRARVWEAESLLRAAMAKPVLPR